MSPEEEKELGGEIFDRFMNDPRIKHMHPKYAPNRKIAREVIYRAHNEMITVEDIAQMTPKRRGAIRRDLIRLMGPPLIDPLTEQEYWPPIGKQLADDLPGRGGKSRLRKIKNTAEAVLIPLITESTEEKNR